MRSTGRGWRSRASRGRTPSCGRHLFELQPVEPRDDCARLHDAVAHAGQRQDPRAQRRFELREVIRVVLAVIQQKADLAIVEAELVADEPAPDGGLLAADAL